MKKYIAAGLVLCLCLGLAACGHTHSQPVWSYKPMEHWYACEGCGEIISEAHTLDAEGYCAICGGTISDNGDGTYNIFTYDEWGAASSELWCEKDGEVLSEMRYENEYDDEGNVLTARAYSDGVLLSETFYELEEDAGHYMSREISYSEDGKTITTYDPYMYPQTAEIYDAAGTLLAEETYEYEFDEFGNMIYSACYTGGALSYESGELLGPDGMMYTEYIRYYSEGTLAGEFTHKYDFSDDGNLVRSRDYTDGILAGEAIYEADADGNYYLAREICYDEDGNITEEYNYDADGYFIE